MLGQRIVNPVGLLVVRAMHRQPDAMQVHGRGKVAQQRHNLDHLGRVRGHLGQFDRGFQLRRRRQIESQRDVLRNVALSARQAVLGNVEAEMSRLARASSLLESASVQLVADPFWRTGALSSRPSS
jgi:hypothetical protein